MLNEELVPLLMIQKELISNKPEGTDAEGLKRLSEEIRWIEQEVYLKGETEDVYSNALGDWFAEGLLKLSYLFLWTWGRGHLGTDLELKEEMQDTFESLLNLLQDADALGEFIRELGLAIAFLHVQARRHLEEDDKQVIH